MLTGGALEREPGHSGLHGRRQVLRRDVEDAIESREVETDTAMDGDHVALETGAGPERRHGNQVLVREREHERDVVGRARVDHEIGPVRCVEAEIGGVEIALGVAVADAIGAEGSQQGALHVMKRDHSSVSEASVDARRSTAQRMPSWTNCSAWAPSRASQATRSSR